MGEPARRLYSEQEYAAMQEGHEARLEYLAGQVREMDLWSLDEDALALEIACILGNLLRNRLCGVQGSNARLRVEATGLLTYPDAAVRCGHRALDARLAHTYTNPVLLVEVLSKSTEAYDRGEKFEHYRQIPSLREYLLVSSERPRVERFERQDDGSWRFQRFGPGERVPVSVAEGSIDVDELYRVMVPEAPAPR